MLGVDAIAATLRPGGEVEQPLGDEEGGDHLRQRCSLFLREVERGTRPEPVDDPVQRVLRQFEAVALDVDVMPALGMRLHPEMGNDLVSRHAQLS